MIFRNIFEKLSSTIDTEILIRSLLVFTSLAKGLGEIEFKHIIKSDREVCALHKDNKDTKSD